MKLTLKHALTAIILVLSFAGLSAADPLKDATAAYRSHDYATALQLFRPLAEQGNAIAQFNLGLMYVNGEGVRQNYSKAFGWFRSAADQGLLDAQNNLGLMYLSGLSPLNMFVSDPRSADAVKKIHLASAVEWFRKAADQGHALAQYNLGRMYFEGLGVPQDFVRAHMWFNLSAAQGEQSALRDRDKVARRMTPAQLAEAQKLAREWKPAKQPVP
jgi:uncharacterized protein